MLKLQRAIPFGFSADGNDQTSGHWLTADGRFKFRYRPLDRDWVVEVAYGLATAVFDSRESLDLLLTHGLHGPYRRLRDARLCLDKALYSPAPEQQDKSMQAAQSAPEVKS